ncbi:Intramolecular chaperone auto-processing domain containing protein [uncultured Caudovirales phage]|uniref:Intramolecular chaperone auto-processing domain containing protein n=1 Tax=uncultured Caudovirales phage TaxID=2100421 RepID=A0A6J5QI57_9CAUD|nr:Intramolecular chaperone auto-processing domain containing protein [uncultured Caudovirales phage]
MTVNYTTNLSLGQPVTGTESGTWGDDVNNSITSYLDIAIAGGLAVTVTTADVTLTLTQGTSSATNIGSTTAQYAILNVSGAMTAARNLIVPSSSRIYLINNNTTGGFALTVKGSATSGVTLVNGEKAHVFWNGTDYAKMSNASGGAGVFSSITNSGLTSGRVVYSTTGGLETDSAGLTFDGTNFATTGTATATKLIPTGSSATGNGLYLPAANSVGISTNGTNAVYIDSTQNVGIGTSSPSSKLQVFASSIPEIRIQSGSFQPALSFYTDNTTAVARNWAIIADNVAYGDLTFQQSNALGGNPITAGTTRMTIDSSGNLLVGTTSVLNTSLFSLAGNFALSGTQMNMAPSADFEFVQRSAFKMLFYVNAATVVANLSITGVWTNASDARYKENITDSPYGLATVMALKPRAYNLINLEDKPQIGFIAQEVIDLVPEVVESVHNSVTNEDRYTLSYGNMVAVLTKAIQEQQALITSLTARIEALESKEIS